MTVNPGGDRSYKKVDVDSLDPDNQSTIQVPYDPSFGDSSGPNENRVRELLQANKLNEALAEA